MFSNDWEKADESVSMDVEILDDKTHHHKIIKLVNSNFIFCIMILGGIK